MDDGPRDLYDTLDPERGAELRRRNQARLAELEASSRERRARIARGSGTSVQDVNRLLKQYAQLRKMMKDMKGMSGGRLGRKDLRRAMPFLRG